MAFVEKERITVEQGIIKSTLGSQITVELSGRKGKWEVPLSKMGKFSMDEEGFSIKSPSLNENRIVPKEGSCAVVAMDWEPESGKALCWAPVPDAFVVKAN